MSRLAILALLALAACGADGAPEPPAAATQGVTMSGSLSAGLARNGG